MPPFVGHPTVAPGGYVGRPRGATNEVANGGLETDVTGWVGTRATVAQDAANAHSGAACLSVTSTADFAYARYTISGLANGDYILSLFEKGGDTPSDSAYIVVGDGVGDLLTIGTFAGSVDWTERSGAFTVSGSPASVFVDLYSRFLGAEGEMLWDDIQVALAPASPYVETDGATASRDPLKVVAP